MFKQHGILRKTMIAFNGSFINYNNELILVPKTNLYFLLNNINNEIEFKCKLLEWCSRDASKTMPFSSDKRNRDYWTFVRERINEVLNTDFNHKEMSLIYSNLGNQINRKKTIKFIESNYDFSLLDRL